MTIVDKIFQSCLLSQRKNGLDLVIALNLLQEIVPNSMVPIWILHQFFLFLNKQTHSTGVHPLAEKGHTRQQLRALIKKFGPMVQILKLVNLECVSQLLVQVSFILLRIQQIGIPRSIWKCITILSSELSNVDNDQLHFHLN